MRKLKTLVIISALSLSLNAADNTQKTMLGMEDGLNSIQKGFLYNSVELIKKGVEKIQESNKVYKDPKAVTAFLPENKKHMSNIAFRSAARIDVATSDLLEYLKAKEMNKAHESFSDILDACTACHSIVRSW
ncbi:MAG: hypothetical protein HXX81_03745 [Campylobacterales bacterium]|nr:hypothetical protein [Campylobacterales bacterium]